MQQYACSVWVYMRCVRGCVLYRRHHTSVPICRHQGCCSYSRFQRWCGYLMLCKLRYPTHRDAVQRLMRWSTCR
jgi:hypothetical protein